jgi:hypothetical protein
MRDGGFRHYIMGRDARMQKAWIHLNILRIILPKPARNYDSDLLDRVGHGHMRKHGLASTVLIEPISIGAVFKLATFRTAFKLKHPPHVPNIGPILHLPWLFHVQLIFS